MSPRASRRREVLEVALEAFNRSGYDGTGIAEIAAASGMTKAAVSYHFPAKTDLLRTLVDPLLDALDAVLRTHDGASLDVHHSYALLAEYFDVLVRHAAVSEWVHGDKSVRNDPEVGPRLDEQFDQVVCRLTGGDAAPAARVAAATAVSSLWASVGHADASRGGEREVVLETVLRGLAAQLA